MKYFKKKHQIKIRKKENFIKELCQGRFGIYFVKSGEFSFSEYKALKIFFKKKLKKLSKKLYIRITPKLKNTKKSIGVRMGKGKGSLNEFYFPIIKGQIFIEFFFNKKKFLLLKKEEKIFLMNEVKQITFLSSLKTKIKLKITKNYNI